MSRLGRLWNVVKEILKRYLLTGIVVTVPLVVSIWVLWLVIGFVDRTTDRLLSLLPDPFGPEHWVHFNFPGLGVIITLLLLILIGALARNLIGRRAMSLTEYIIERIPLMRSVYSAIKQLLTTLFVANTGNFKRVALIEYPRPGIWTLAFVTNDNVGVLKSVLPEPCSSVFVPTTPNPTSGYYVIVPKRELINIEVSVEQAFKMLISAGIIAEASTGVEAD
ncbi:MAG: DUF502 domain-containing protein [Candidatus Alcyoniella australis]|nr:DUF502 domain-containing protein [Candidatus Alcyoniella australis]